MNAIISLCHFCEVHGPQVLFCTQPLHPLERTTSTDSDDTVTGGRLVRSSSITNEPTTPTSATPKNDFCGGCSSVKTGFISRDEDAQVNYISSKQPYDREVYSMSRQACLRSLTGEVCPGNDGPIFFGNDQQGHVLSYTFHINDSQARGFSQRYSILVVMMDKIYLLNSWPFLVPHLKTVIEHITKKANIVYEREKAKIHQHPPQTSRWSKPARSLMDLTDDRNIFKILHLSFVWILKACGNRITETLLEGPPTEDSIIDMEKQEETEEGFCLIFSKKVNIEEVEDSSSKEVSERLEVEEGEEEGPVILNIRHLMKILGEDKFHVLAHHVVIGNQIIVRSSLKSVVKSLLNVLKSLLPKGCCRVIPYSPVYEESWKCNFLGLPPEVDLPMHIMSDETFVLVEISEQTSTDTQSGEEKDLLNRLDFNMASPRTLPDKAPSALYKMELAIQNNDLTDTVVEHYLICLKEEWMNKVKVRFKFTKAGGSRSEEDTKKLLQVIGAKEEDTPLLKFWMQGLSLQYRNHILTTSKSSR
ncbi:folliculin-like [Saccostrea echinata]|uniref:folliculin-like n=1 Tax=Saccostrea echinata TaxID=191078 RepID=UPI002A7EFE25|nr:folliculin-like [Saccostrea echinata]